MRRLAISFVFLLLTLGFLYLLFALQITSQSKIAGYTLKVDRFGFAQFLIKSGYYKGEGLWKVAGVTLTGERQRFMTITKDVSLPPFQSASIKNDQKRMEILAHYDGSVLEEILSYGNDGQKGINLTLLAYVCVAQSETKTGLLDRESCYQMAESYLEKNPGMIFKLERESAKTGLRLVRTARAASCYGVVECEPLTTVCSCSVGGAACVNSGDRCGPGGSGTCGCSSSCNSSGGGAMDYYYCSGQTTQSSCVNQTGANASCESKGLCAVPGGCYWDGGGTTPTPTPPPGGTIDCGTQTCNASTEVCCATGCKPISEGCTAPPPPPVSYQCTVQGYKVLMPGLLTGAPASSQTVTLNDPLTSTSTQPYFFF